MPDILDILNSRCRVHAYVWRKIESTCPFGRAVHRLSEMLLHYELLSLVLIFCKRISKLCKNPTMLFDVDMIYLAKQAKRDVEKSFALRWGP